MAVRFLEDYNLDPGQTKQKQKTNKKDIMTYDQQV
jgi:hypothetical protein